MSKHSPTLVTSSIGGATALAVPVQNDPLILERTVNHIIYSRNGNGNGNGNGHGSENGDGAFLYSDNDLHKIIFPNAESAEYSTPPDAEPAPYESAAAVHAQAPMDAPPTVEAAPPPEETSPAASDKWEPPSPKFASVLAAGAIGTPMAAGAAHALASLAQGAAVASQAAAPGPGVSSAPYADPQTASDNSQLTGTGTSHPSYVPPQEVPVAKDDFFAGASNNAPPTDILAAMHAQQQQVGNLARGAAPENLAAEMQGAAQSASGVHQFGPPPDHQTSSGVNQFGPAPDQAASGVQQFGPPPDAQINTSVSQLGAAPNSTGSSGQAAASSAHASKRPGMMDFFSATMSEPEAAAPTSNSNAEQSFSSTEGGAPSYMSGSPSIIQNAIQAAAALNASGGGGSIGAVDMQSSSSLEMQSPVKKKKSSSSGSSSKKSSLRPSPDQESAKKTGIKSGSSTKSSGKSSAASKIRLNTDYDDEKPTKKSSGKSSSKSDNFELAGFSIPSKFLKIGAILVVFAFPLMVIVSTVFSLLSPFMSGSGGGTVLSGAASSNASSGLSGQWELGYMNPNGSSATGILVLQQNGNQLQGYGTDKAQFQVTGAVDGNTVKFNKQYIQSGQAVGKPILYAGKLDFVSQKPQQHPTGAFWYYAHMSGVWQLTKAEGMSWRRQIITLTGKWEAYLSKPANGQTLASAGNNVPMPTGNIGAAGGNMQSLDNKDPKKAHEFFLKIALGIIGVGVALAMASLRFFGPSGLLNIWAKKEYIPSQFKAQHFKMVAEMGRPLRPGGCPLGDRADWGLHQFWRPKRLNFPPELREQNPHTLILGAGAKGKSRLMASMIAHDIEGGERAVVVVDSDGALIDLMLNWISAHPKGKQLAKRVVVIDPTHDGEPICYNPLEYPEDGDLQNAASSIVFGFKAIYTEPPGSQSQWNQQTANILRNSAILLMANGKTLTDLPVLLSDNDFRDVLLEKVERVKHEKSEYTTLIDAWSNYKRLARTDQWINWIEPILNRVQPMLGDPRIRPILTQAKSDLNLQKIIKDKMILFVKIPQGQLDQNGNLLGSMMVTGIKQAALSLSVNSKEKRRPCALYLDEFDNFIEKETFDAITSETRKFQLGFCGASKTLQTLPEDYRNQLVINVGMMAIFALAKKDGDMLGPQMFRVDGRKVKHQTIQNVFNKVNSSFQFELISDEEKLNIDRVVGQEERTYFCYRVGTVAGVFNMKSPEFKDVAEKDINPDILEMMFTNRMVNDEDEDEEEDDDDE